MPSLALIQLKLEPLEVSVYAATDEDPADYEDAESKRYTAFSLRCGCFSPGETYGSASG